MADESTRDEEQWKTPGEEEEGGLGNLPPLSDFDSGDAGRADAGNLPPLGRLESDAGFRTPGELPPARDVKMDTPRPRQAPGTPHDPGGLITPEFNDAPAFDTPTSDLDTPEPGEGFGFQDLAADSDFSPETPEIGPGPDSDVDTPMFDSAFGGDSGDFGTPDPGRTGAPTQAMETPMFDASPSPAGGGDFGFDNDAFGGAPLATPLDRGTPIPDFSPDTGAPISSHGISRGDVAVPPRKQKGGVGVLGLLLAAMIALIVGILAGPYVSNSVEVLPDPYTAQLEEKDQTIETQERQIRELIGREPAGGTEPLTPEMVDELIRRRDEAQRGLTEAEENLARMQTEIAENQAILDLVESDIETQNQAYVEAQELLEQLQNDTEITRARHEGLVAESERLTAQVGQLEEADARRAATKDAMLHSLNRLIIEIEDGIPLTPARYSRDERLQSARDLRAEVQAAKWVNPELMNKYTDVYLREMEIAASRDYFFARIPVHDRLGNQILVWAECLMNGNWSVYYRSLDGEHVGAFENIGGSDSPDYEFREDLPVEATQQIAAAITAARPPDYQEKFAVLQAKQDVYDTRTTTQRNFDSL